MERETKVRGYEEKGREWTAGGRKERVRERYESHERETMKRE